MDGLFVSTRPLIGLNAPKAASRVVVDIIRSHKLVTRAAVATMLAGTTTGAGIMAVVTTGDTTTTTIPRVAPLDTALVATAATVS